MINLTIIIQQIENKDDGKRFHLDVFGTNQSKKERLTENKKLNPKIFKYSQNGKGALDKVVTVNYLSYFAKYKYLIFNFTKTFNFIHIYTSSQYLVR